jgi:putative FmdB family regulatory protein
MPTYEYVCTKCGERLEAVQSFSDAPLTDCPACGKKKALRKVFSAVGVVFKGSGFYKTDSRSNGKASSTTTSSEPAASKSSASESKSDSSTSKSDSGSSSSSSTTSSSSAKDGGSKVA